MRIVITENFGNPPDKVADAEIHFEPKDGPLSGLKLIGFGIWRRRIGNDYNVTFPARQYNVNGERRNFALLRPSSDANSQNAIRDAILDAYRLHIAPPVTPQQLHQDARQDAPRRYDPPTTTTPQNDPPIGQDEPQAKIETSPAPVPTVAPWEF